MNRYNILWIDDDFNNPELRPDKDALSNKDCNIIGFDNPDKFLGYLENNNDQDNIDCIIIDLSMPIGKKLQKKKTKDGMAAGWILLEIVLDSRFKDTPKVVYTITDNEEVKDYCKNVDVPYWNKMNYMSDEFAESIIRLIIG